MILSERQIAELVKDLKNNSKKIVLAGGCFDILHPGHVIFLTKAKRAGDILIILLESDQKVRKLKGTNRPVHSQKDRAKILSALEAVDYIVMLPFIESETAYDRLVQKIKPDIIALTKGYNNYSNHKRAAKLSGARLKYVTQKVGDHSSSKILNHK